MTREIWLGMQAHEDEAKADCGCTLYRHDDESDDPFYVQCPLHAQAEGMRAFIRRVSYESVGHALASHTDVLAILTEEARALLRATEGK